MTEIPGNRETAYRVFAAEFDDATVSHQESDEERAPNYVITPTGGRVNRLFAVGVLTEVEAVNDDVLRARVVDPTGAFVVYAGQYQPDEMAALERLDPPAFVAVTGKARTFSPDDSDRVYTSIRPESINTVDAETRDRWVVRTAEHTEERVGVTAAAAELDASGDALRDALDARDLPEATAAGATLALEHYDPTPAYLEGIHELALDAAEVVVGDREEVKAYDRSPDDTGDGTASYAALAADIGDGPVPTSTDEAPADSPDATTDAARSERDASATDAAADAAAEERTETTAEATTDASDGGDESAAEATAEVTAATTESAVESSSESTTASSDAGAESATDSATEDSSATSTEETATSTEETAGADESATGTEASTAEASTAEADDEGDSGVGDFEPGDMGGEAQANTDEMYEFDEDEREEIEAEYGTEFSSGNDVPDPGESELDAPESDEADAPEPDESTAADRETAAEGGTDASADEEHDDASADSTDEGSANASGDVDLDEYVMETMRDLDDGDGADRDALIEAVVTDTGASPDEVEDAVQNALMGGQCYEPDDDVLKPI